MNRLDVLD